MSDLTEIEILLAFEELERSNPKLYGGIIGACIGVAVVLALCLVFGYIEYRIARKNKKATTAIDLIGEDVVYTGPDITIMGRVLMVRYRLEESGEIKVDVYIEIGNRLFAVLYDDNIRLKGGEE